MKKISQMLQEMSALIGKLKSSDDHAKFKESMNRIQKEADEIISYCRASSKFDENAVKEKINRVNDGINDQLALLKTKVSEEEKLRKVQELMDSERKKKEEEMSKKRDEEELKRKRVELDERFKLESKRVDDRELALKLQKQMDAELEQQRMLEQKRLEQEALDHELALRLAQESSNGLTEDLVQPKSNCISPPLGTPVKSGIDKKYDLSKWKYSDLRDIINTSCDIELLEACKEEFHRRLKVYHAWKLKNSRNKEIVEESRAPDSIMHNLGPFDGQNSNSKSSNEQRYFRIPFVRPSSATGQRGWWWAHFDGQWIARQMEIHPEKKSILLVAGKCKPETQQAMLDINFCSS